MRPNPEDKQGTTATFEKDSEDVEMEFEETGAVNIENPGVKELFCQALETEVGGVRIYETAIRCAQNEELKDEWNKYLDETRNHERILRDVFEQIGFDADTDTPGRRVVKATGEALVNAMETALSEGDPSVAQIVAAECVVLAETKDHLNWELIGEVADDFEGEGKTALQEAYEEVEEQEDEHLYHTRGWARELWLESFGLPAVLPPPEEAKKVTTEIGAARAKESRGEMLTATKKKNAGRANVKRATKSRTNRAGAQKTKAKPTRGRGRSR